MIKKITAIAFMIIFIAIIVKISIQEQTINIGFIDTLSGISSDFGKSTLRGAELAAKEINKNGGINGKLVQLIPKDIKNNSDIIKRKITELSEKNVAAIIGPGTSYMAVNALPVINDMKILTIGPIPASDTLTGLDDYFLRLNLPNKVQAGIFAKYIVKEVGISEIDIIYDASNKEYTENFANNFKETFEKNGGKVNIIADYVSKANTNYGTILEPIINSKSQGILIIANGLDTGILTQLIRNKSTEKKLFSSGWAKTNEFLEYAGHASEGMLFVSIANRNSENKKYLDFEKRFVEEYKTNTDDGAVYGYEAVQLLAEGLAKSKKLKGDEIKKTLLTIRKFQGLIDDYEIDKFGDPIKRIWIDELKNGTFKAVDSYE